MWKASLAAIAVAYTLAGAGEARAATKLCFKTGDSAVPERAVFVLPADAAAELKSEGHVHSGSGHESLDFAPIDGHYTRVVVRAKAGDTYRLRDAGFCGNRRGGFVVDSSWTPANGAQLKLRLDESKGLIATWGGPDETFFLRVDWAYDDKELSKGEYQTILQRFEEKGYRHRLYFARGALQEDMIFLRITRYTLDGKEKVWRGWAYEDSKGKLVLGHRKVPKDVRDRFSAKTRCPTMDPVHVPSQPGFLRYGFGGDSTAFIETPAGKPVPYRTQGEELFVRAREGTIFQIDHLPRKVCPHWYVVDAKSKPALTLPGETELGSYGGPREDWTFDLSPDSPEDWPFFHVKWSATLEGLDRAKGRDMEPYHASFTNMHWESSQIVPDDLEEFYVELTPLWRDKGARVSTRGKVRIVIDDTQRIARFTPL